MGAFDGLNLYQKRYQVTVENVVKTDPFIYSHFLQKGSAHGV